MKKRILIVCTEPPFPCINGVRIPLRDTLLALSGHADMHVLCLLDRELPIDISEFKSMNVGVDIVVCHSHWGDYFRAFLAGHPASSWISYNGNARSAFRRIESGFLPDVIHVDLARLAALSSDIVRECRVIISINDSPVLFAKEVIRSNYNGLLRRLYSLFTLPLVMRYEEFISFGADIVRVVSGVDALYLKDRYGARNVRVIPTLPECIESSFFCRSGVGFLGVMNGDMDDCVAEFVSDIWRRLNIPSGVGLFLGGSVAGGRVRMEAGRSAGVFLISPVPDLNNFFDEFTIFINPLRRRCGVSNKILQAMVAGKACIGYRETFGGIEFAMHDKNCIMVDDIDGFRMALQALLDSESTVDRLRKAAIFDSTAWLSKCGVAEAIRSVYLGDLS